MIINHLCYFQCAVLKARLEDAVQNQRTCEERASKLSEELASTTQGYDTQLAVMSEHLANMNEKLALQKDKIDHLEFQSKVNIFKLHPHYVILHDFCVFSHLFL